MSSYYVFHTHVKRTVIPTGVLMMPSLLDALSCSFNENIYFYHKEKKVQVYDCVRMYVLFALCVYLLRKKGFKLFLKIFYFFPMLHQI